MANEYLKPQIPLKDLNSENYFYPLTTSDQIFLSDTTTRLNSLIDHTNFIPSRAIYYNGTKLLSSGNIFLNDNQVGINLTSITPGFQLDVNGHTRLNGRIALVHGIYTATSASRYMNSALEIRENDLVGTAQTDIGYAPSLGFHWSGKVGATLSLGSNGVFYFRKQNGLERATINAFLPNTSHGDNTTDTTSYSWHKVASVTIKSDWSDRWIKLSITNGYNAPNETGILFARIRTNGNIVLENANLIWLVAGSSVRLDSFKLVYYNETNQVRAELWYQVQAQYYGAHFTIIDQGAREFIQGEGESDWQLTERVWGHGQASCPTGSGSVSSGATFLLNTSNQARYLENRGGSTVTINDTAWPHGHVPYGHTNRATIWHQRWYQSGLTYTPSGGSATTLSDSADMVLWLSSANASNILQLNIAIDGNFYTMQQMKAGGGRFGYDNYSYSLSTASFICNSWVRTKGSAGWYSEDHGGGWYMSDNDWLRSYNNKSVYTGGGTLRSDNNVWGNRVCLCDNWIGFYQSTAGGNRYGYIQADTNRMRFRKENGAQGSISYDFAGHIYNSAEYISGANNGFRIKNVILRNDGGNFYFLIGTANTPGDNWNSLRPFYFNLSNGYSYHIRAYQAVWNDYAEFRQGDTIEPGRVVIEQKNGIMTMAQERLAPGAKIISDTYGQAMGETKTAKTPIAVSGRVLVYPFRDRNKYELGAAVCAAPGGTVDIMTREEIREYPERIVGTVSEIPNYDIWHAGGSVKDGPTEEIKVNGRIWVYVR